MVVGGITSIPQCISITPIIGLWVMGCRLWAVGGHGVILVSKNLVCRSNFQPVVTISKTPFLAYNNDQTENTMKTAKLFI